KALQHRENILVYGDYDVDGTSAVALMSSFLLSVYTNVGTYIPDRYDEGYGVSYQGIDFAHDNSVSLIIALDCGIKAVDKVAYAREKGIDFIICDHHLPGETIPDAVAVLDPKRNDCLYPYKELCGCGVGFKLIQALGERLGKTTEDLMPYLDLVATAIGADIVPITGENRVLAYFGLQVINSNPRAGFRAIIQTLKKKTLDVSDVVFIIAPRINAAGRMKHGSHAVELMTETDIEQAQIYAEEIENYNLSRREADSEITQEALQLIENQGEQDRFTTVVYRENWHKGVIGIVASRLTETYYRPTVVFTKSGEKLAASARSVRHFDLYQALEACEEYIEQFGGHKYAAGLTILPENYEPFKQKFEEIVAATIEPEMLIPEISADLEIKLTDVNSKFFRILKQFAPFGPGNMTPVFLTKNLIESGYSRRVGEEDKHLRLVVKPNGGEFITGIGFNMGEKYEAIKDKKPFDIVYSLDENEWNGNKSIQLKIRDLKLSEEI
ncbi:MAG TPA: single-stranded-DNA-specific exonuclease RecJ, partial [Flavobacteriaceae bacterium]|nr:single-stranded-DNA-specific exonuclease RecJ [Flavobacteriaceae bacterium]